MDKYMKTRFRFILKNKAGPSTPQNQTPTQTIQEMLNIQLDLNDLRIIRAKSKNSSKNQATYERQVAFMREE